ncbi:TetR/AcrR family transcriptional regulator [Methylocystis parvus]|uniref:TetR/AcrR family transcriptional regulator n=1 Tax=Methylocystis parvus TaxID=134 RepID=A0A6B8M8Y2_9HYPH|nr:TetR/AcrR family transcriptional regulator [Methylocystis parvus]QGM98855.1 TetR/AcrR family transcriptional regulator [Methylocystis parvus]WBK00792.1 TetR/AcrR family transcriptional regulator [Methylocystis parvus OBBP]
METQEKARGVSRASEATRAALIKAAVSVFSEHGYEGGSVRLITRRAEANQAAINYHFGGKEGLYRAVLEAAAEALEKESFLDAEGLDRLPPEDALRLYLRQFLSPLVKRDRVSQYLRLYTWESVRPSAVFKSFFEARPPRIFRLAERVVRRFSPEDAPREEVAIRTLWLAQQPIFFVRETELLAMAPFGLDFDAAGLERLVDALARLSLAGLRGA